MSDEGKIVEIQRSLHVVPDDPIEAWDVGFANGLSMRDEMRRERDEARQRARIAAKALLLLDADLARFQDVFDRQAVEAAWPWVLRWRDQIRSALAADQPAEAGGEVG